MIDIRLKLSLLAKAKAKNTRYELSGYELSRYELSSSAPGQTGGAEVVIAGRAPVQIYDQK